MPAIQNPDEPALERRYERFSKRAERIAWLIVAGLALDLVVVCISDAPIREKTLQALADALIVGGVAGELAFERIARTAGDSVTALARERAAQATERAAKAELETERIKKQVEPRRISSEQYAKIAATLKGHPMDVGMSFSQGDPEARQYADDILKIFNAVGLQPSLTAVLSTEVMIGLKIHPRRDDDPDAALIIEAFKRGGLTIELSLKMPFLMFEVGSKPAPF
ncbi:MAG TPA: hypothetical protein VEU95_15735 [Micropepsaceae bacterium]|nr:hypothetical protein [Micropepsaceae bacterium]